MSCNLTVEQDGTITIVADNGKPSILFKDAKAFTGNPELASDIWGVGNSQEYKELYTEPQIAEYQTKSGTSGYPKNIDENREPKLEDVVRYIAQENVKESLTDKELVQLKTNLVNTSLENSDELKTVLNKAFFPAPTLEKLRATNLYTSTEINNILRSDALQNKIKEFTLKLNNTEETVEKESNVDERFLTGTGTNDFGKIQLDNPYINEQDAVSKLGGTPENLFDSTLENSDLDYLKSQKDLFPFFDQFKKVVQKVFTGNSLVNKPKTDTQELFNQVLKEDENGAVRGRISNLLNVHPYAWETSSKAVKTLLEALDRDAIKIGLDLKNLEDFYEDRDVNEIKGFLASVSTMLSTGDIENFTPIYNDFFGVDTSVKISAEKLKTEDKNKSVYKVVSNEPAYNIFKETGLIPLGENIFQRTDALKKGVEELYTILKANTGLTEEDIQKDIKNIDVSKVNVVDSEVLQKMAIYARLFNSKLENTKQMLLPIQDQYIKFQGVGETFVADFYSKQLQEQRKDSEEYNSFYNKFQVGENGITPISVDPISVAEINSQIGMHKGLANYFNSKIDSELRFPVEMGEEIDDSYLRQYYANYPQSLNIYQDLYQQINPTTIEAQSKQPFLRINNGVYELSNMVGNSSLYTKLNLNENTQYKDYNLNTAPDSKMIPTSIDETSTPITITNLYSKSQGKEISDKLNCI